MSFDADLTVLKEVTTLIHQEKKSFLQHILLLGCSLFGILISLHDNALQSHNMRLCFALALVLLALGILCLSIALYCLLDVIVRARKAYVQEFQNALGAHRSTSYAYVGARKIFGIVESIGYFCLIVCVLLLASYSVLLAL